MVASSVSSIDGLYPKLAEVQGLRSLPELAPTEDRPAEIAAMPVVGDFAPVGTMRMD